jgi:hypothetical protein
LIFKKLAMDVDSAANFSANERSQVQSPNPASSKG